MASRYLKKFPIPIAFPELFYNFAKEILRDQPGDLIEYGYLYFKAMESVLW
jgi:hypothetical protein